MVIQKTTLTGKKSYWSGNDGKKMSEAKAMELIKKWGLKYNGEEVHSSVKIESYSGLVDVKI